MILPFIALIVGYLLGSIPTGVIVSMLAGAQDPRGIGSGNIGATNVLRTGRKDLAALTLLGDALKGTVAVLLAAALLSSVGDAGPTLAAAFGAFLGHLFPLYLGFRGGKGVATFLGCLIGVAWPAALAFAAIWLATAFASRYSSAAALIASATTPLVLLAIHRGEAAALFAVLAAILWLKHHANIGRLLGGTESKIGARREPVS